MIERNYKKNIIRKSISFIIVLIAGLTIIYHRMIQPINSEWIFIPLILYSMIMLVFYRKIHGHSHFHILAILVIVIHTVLMNEYLQNDLFIDFLVTAMPLITMSFFVSSIIIRYSKVKDRNIKKIMNKLSFPYALWIILFYSPFANVLTGFIAQFAGPIPDHIDSALFIFWLISDIWFIIVVIAQIINVFLYDQELIYRNDRIAWRKAEAMKQREKEKDIFGFGEDFYEKEY